MSAVKQGDLVTCVKRNGWGSGALYRVLSVGSSGLVRLSCVYGAFPGRRRKERTGFASQCRKVGVNELRESLRSLESLVGGEMNRCPKHSDMAAATRKFENEKRREALPDDE